METLTNTIHGVKVGAMELTKQRITIAENCGWKRYNPEGLDAYNLDYPDKPFPDYYYDLNAMHDAEKYVGIHDRNNLQLRVKWVNNLRKVVAVDCPKNNIGAPIVSDIDLINATAAQRAEAFLKTLGLWKQSE